MKLNIECDGCDRQEKMVSPDRIPGTWSYVTITIAPPEGVDRGKASKDHKNYVLCARCTGSVRKSAFADEWPRVATELP